MYPCACVCACQRCTWAGVFLQVCTHEPVIMRVCMLRMLPPTLAGSPGLSLCAYWVLPLCWLLPSSLNQEGALIAAVGLRANPPAPQCPLLSSLGDRGEDGRRWGSESSHRSTFTVESVTVCVCVRVRLRAGSCILRTGNVAACPESPQTHMSDLYFPTEHEFTRARWAVKSCLAMHTPGASYSCCRKV